MEDQALLLEDGMEGIELLGGGTGFVVVVLGSVEEVVLGSTDDVVLGATDDVVVGGTDEVVLELTELTEEDELDEELLDDVSGTHTSPSLW